MVSWFQVELFAWNSLSYPIYRFRPDANASCEEVGAQGFCPGYGLVYRCLRLYPNMTQIHVRGDIGQHDGRGSEL